jgi:hypothetical protein
VFRSLFGFAALIATVSVFAVAYVRDPVIVVVLLSTTLFFLRWCGMYWAIPSTLGTRDRAGFLGGCMNLGGRHHRTDHRRLHRADHRIVLPGVDVLRRSRCRSVRLLDRDRLQPQAASLMTPSPAPPGQFGEPVAKTWGARP